MNLKNFLASMAAMLTPIGEAVIAMHPNNPNEAFKIELGTQLLQGVAATLLQSVNAAQTAAPAPAPIVTATPAPTGQNVVNLAVPTSPSTAAPDPTLQARVAELEQQVASTAPAVGNG